MMKCLGRIHFDLPQFQLQMSSICLKFNVLSAGEIKVVLNCWEKINSSLKSMECMK